MTPVIYSIISFLALIVHVIINNDVFRRPDNSKNGTVYRRFIAGILVYFVIDVLWGFIAFYHSTLLLYIDTILYCGITALILLFWCQYVISYLNIQNFFGKFLKVAGFLFCICAVASLSINHFFPIFFWIDEQGGYHTDFFRYISVIAQITLFSLTTIKTLTSIPKSGSSAKRHHITIACFGLVMIVAVFLQFINPLFPCYTMGLLIGTCIIHVFIQEDLKDNFRNKLEESYKAIAAAGYGIWKFTFDQDGMINGLIGNETWQKIFGTDKMNLSPTENLQYFSSRLSTKTQEEIKNDYTDMRNGAITSRTLE